MALNTIQALHVEIEIYTPSFPFGDAATLLATVDQYKEAADTYYADKTRNGEPSSWSSFDMWLFWKTYYMQLPCWYDLAEEVALILTSSASVERVFSLYESMFGHNDQACLEDLREASVKLRYNDKNRNSEE